MHTTKQLAATVLVLGAVGAAVVGGASAANASGATTPAGDGGRTTITSDGPVSSGAPAIAVTRSGDGSVTIRDASDEPTPTDLRPTGR
ncbi:hypothetical protein ACRQ4B_15450 [Curtobacterium sp. SP.BCo]|uniref:hypothetical protein n=1 Tax=Curtobacterium sp. SP.BCo TaxID=3435229 RepID=UPI003F73BD76